MGRLDEGMTVGAAIGSGVLIGHDEQDVGLKHRQLYFRLTSNCLPNARATLLSVDNFISSA